MRSQCHIVLRFVSSNLVIVLFIKSGLHLQKKWRLTFESVKKELGKHWGVQLICVCLLLQEMPPPNGFCHWHWSRALWDLPPCWRAFTMCASIELTVSLPHMLPLSSPGSSHSLPWGEKYSRPLLIIARICSCTHPHVTPPKPLPQHHAH
jgi:hypothetical protein